MDLREGQSVETAFNKDQDVNHSTGNNQKFTTKEETRPFPIPKDRG